MPAYTVDPVTIASGNGVYSGDEWGKTRQASEPYLTEGPSDAAYRRAAYLVAQRIGWAIEFTDWMDLRGYHKLGDIGGAPFFQALVILDRNPHLSALLTDYDATTLAALRHIPMLAQYEMELFDASTGELTLFNDCDLITMWGVDYALSDEALGRLIQYCVMRGSTLVIGADWRATTRKALHTRLRYSRVGTAVVRMVRGTDRPIRAHGILRTEAYLRQLIAAHGGTTTHVQRIGDYRVLCVR